MIEEISVVDVATIERTFDAPYRKITVWMKSRHPNGGTTQTETTNGSWTCYINNMTSYCISGIGVTSHGWDGLWRVDFDVSGGFLTVRYSAARLSGSHSNFANTVYGNVKRMDVDKISSITIAFSNADNLAESGECIIMGVRKT